MHRLRGHRLLALQDRPDSLALLVVAYGPALFKAPGPPFPFPVREMDQELILFQAVGNHDVDGVDGRYPDPVLVRSRGDMDYPRADQEQVLISAFTQFQTLQRPTSSESVQLHVLHDPLPAHVQILLRTGVLSFVDPGQPDAMAEFADFKDRRLEELQTALRPAWRLGACMIRARRMGVPEEDFRDLVFSISDYANVRGILMEDVVDAEKELSLWKDPVSISEEDGAWASVIPPIMQVREVLES